MYGRVQAVILLVISAAYCGAASTLIRGASPDNIEKYTPKDGKFTCFDGSLTIDFSQMNDNFCDCPDSSDEPGTSACPNGVFYCRNRGHEPRLLATSFVDDGICDCCDGTDELSGCKNTCIEKNSAKRDAIKKQIDDYKAALDRKGQYVSSAHGVREHIKQRYSNVDSEIEKAEQELQRLAAERKQAEEESEVKREQHKEEQAKLAAQRKADAEAARKKAEEDAAAQKAADEAAAAAPAEAGDAAQEGEGAPHAETDEERGRRIASQWTNDPAAAGAAASEKDDSTDEENVGESYLSRVYSRAKETVNKLVKGDDAPAPDDEFAEGDDAVLPPSPYEMEEDGWTGSDDPDYQHFDDSQLRQAQADHDAAEKKLAELKAEKERVNRQVEYNFNDAWAGLLNKCLESRQPQFTYKFCFFDKATQLDNGGGHETSLGFWKGFEKGGTEAVFEGGDYCHKHPARSLRVKLECGGEERAWDASEPSTCAYMVHASTPAACKADTLKELQDTMDALLAEEEQLSKEIAEEEKQREAQLAAMREKMGAASHDEL